MNIPPARRDQKIDIIQKLSKEAALAPFFPPEKAFFKEPATFSKSLGVGGFTFQELNKKLDHQLDAILRGFSCYKEYYANFDEEDRFFSQKECRADFEYWAKFPHWSIDEGTTLLLGKDPRKVLWGNI